MVEIFGLSSLITNILKMECRKNERERLNIKMLSSTIVLASQFACYFSFYEAIHASLVWGMAGIGQWTLCMPAIPSSIELWVFTVFNATQGEDRIYLNVLAASGSFKFPNHSEPSTIHFFTLRIYCSNHVQEAGNGWIGTTGSPIFQILPTVGSSSASHSFWFYHYQVSWATFPMG